MCEIDTEIEYYEVIIDLYVSEIGKYANFIREKFCNVEVAIAFAKSYIAESDLFCVKIKEVRHLVNWWDEC